MGSPQSPAALWGEETQASGRSFRRQAEAEPSELCGDEDAPSFVTDAQLEELNIKVTAKEEEGHAGTGGRLCKKNIIL